MLCSEFKIETAIQMYFKHILKYSNYKGAARVFHLDRRHKVYMTHSALGYVKWVFIYKCPEMQAAQHSTALFKILIQTF